MTGPGGSAVAEAGDARPRRRSRARSIAFWIVTLLLAQENVAGAIWGCLRLEFIATNLAHLGYPPYFTSYFAIGDPPGKAIPPLVYASLALAPWALRALGNAAWLQAAATLRGVHALGSSQPRFWFSS
jgi:hypothetical protein